MEKYVYIKLSIPSHFVDFEESLNPEEYNNIGATYEDYLDNKWVLLSDEQVAFYEANKGASVKEVWDMQLRQRTIDDAKNEKLSAIAEYDKSEAVNSFTIGNMTMWLTVSMRQQLATQISANEAMGRDTMSKWFDGHEFSFPISVWKQMLIALEVYAGDALNVTEYHKSAVKALESIEEVDGYDITAGYPEKLHFNF